MSPQPDAAHDEEIACVREARHRISERFGHDPYRLVAYYLERQQERETRLAHAPEPEAAGDAAGPRPPESR